jgi:hypothetical protein
MKLLTERVSLVILFVSKPKKLSVHTSAHQMLRFVCYKNFGTILEHEADFENALDYYLKAFQLDNSDSHLSVSIAQLALKIKKPLLAKSMFEHALSLPNNCHKDILHCLQNIARVCLIVGFNV